MATKRLHKQWFGLIIIFLLKIAAIGVLAFLCVKIYQNDIDVNSKSSGIVIGLKGLLSSLVNKLAKHGHEDISKWIIIGMCILAILYIIFYNGFSIIHITPKHTKLGRSLLRQASSNESLKDLCKQIDHDIAGGYKEFGADTIISASWIMEAEAMRLSSIKKISEIDGFGNNGLIFEDENNNRMIIDFVLKAPTEEALAYLKERLPLVEIFSYNASNARHIGKMYSWHIPKNNDEIEEYKRLAELGDANAQTEYGKCILFGKGGSTDATAAYEWFEKAAAQSNEIAKMYIGHCILYGIGVDRDEEKGYIMLDNALNYNYPEESESQPLANYSQFHKEDLVQLFWDIGDARENALGISKRYASAVYYFSMIYDWGYQEGAKRLEHYKKGLKGWEKKA